MIATQCCIVGGGPAGMMLGFLLARAGVKVVVLEKHGDFLRDFRGDTVHPSTLEVMYSLAVTSPPLSPVQVAVKVNGPLWRTLTVSPTDIRVIDCMLGIPEAEDRSAWFEFFRPLLKDAQSVEQFTMPAQYMFKDIPQSGKTDDFVAWTVDQMDRFNIEKALVGWNGNATSLRAFASPYSLISRLSVSRCSSAER